MANKFRHGDEPNGEEAGPSAANIGVNSENMDTVREGTVFIDLSVLFGVFDEVLKCRDCGEEMKSHVDMRKKHGYAHIFCSMYHVTR